MSYPILHSKRKINEKRRPKIVDRQEDLVLSCDLCHCSTYPRLLTSSQRSKPDLNNLLKKNRLDGRRTETGSGYLS